MTSKQANPDNQDQATPSLRGEAPQEQGGKKTESVDNKSRSGEQAVSPFVTADYQERQDARRNRLLNRAEQAKQASQTACERAYDMASVIPAGQPILVGHHSEQRDRRYRKKIDDTFGQSVSLEDKAKHYEQQAESVGDAGIASNDPQAIQKLEKKLAQLIAKQDMMKAVNKITRLRALSDEQKIAKVVEDGLLDIEQAREVIIKDNYGCVGFQSFSLQGNNAEIRRIKGRIAGLKALHNSVPVAFENNDFSMAVNNGQIVIGFLRGQPSYEVQTLVKRYAFKWSSYQKAWVRKVTLNAVVASKRLLKTLQELEKIY